MKSYLFEKISIKDIFWLSLFGIMILTKSYSLDAYSDERAPVSQYSDERAPVSQYSDERAPQYNQSAIPSYTAPSTNPRYTVPTYKAPANNPRYTVPRYTTPSQITPYTTPPSTKSYGNTYSDTSSQKMGQLRDQYKSPAERLKEMKAEKLFEQNSNQDFFVRRSGGWREHPLSKLTQEIRKGVPVAEKNFIDKTVMNICDNVEFTDFIQVNKYNCRNESIKSYSVYDHAGNHFENQWKKQAKTHKDDYIEKLYLSRERMMNNMHNLHQAVVTNICATVMERGREKRCRRIHSKALHNLQVMSFGRKTAGDVILKDVKKSLDHYSFDVPFLLRGNHSSKKNVLDVSNFGGLGEATFGQE